MKKIFSSNSELVHIWANNDDSSILKSASSVSCQYDRLFSYSTCIAEIYNGVTIHNSHTYSNSTTEHQILARQSSHGKKLYISIPKRGLQSLVFGQGDFDRLIVEYNEQKASDYLMKADRSRKNSDYYKSQAHGIIQSLIDYAELLGLSYQYDDERMVELKDIALAERMKELAREKEYKLARITEQAEALTKWRNGENVYRNFEVIALRLKDNIVETSRGAKIPVDHAIKAYPLLKKMHDKQVDVDLTGHTIKFGNYEMSAFKNGSLIIGCHTIPFAEVSLIANQLGL